METTDQPRVKVSRSLNSRNRDEFWRMADEAAAKLTSKEYVMMKYMDIFEELNARFAFMNYRYINQMGRSLHNKNFVRAKLAPEIALASMLYEWRDIDRFANPDKLSFREWYENGKVTIYSGKPFNMFEPERIMNVMNLPEGKFVSTSFKRDIAIPFTQSGRASGAWWDTKKMDGWLLETEISPRQVYFFTNINHEYECLLKGPFDFERKTRIIAGQPGADDDWGIHESYKNLFIKKKKK